jgi:hypothetical protein
MNWLEVRMQGGRIHREASHDPFVIHKLNADLPIKAPDNAATTVKQQCELIR